MKDRIKLVVKPPKKRVGPMPRPTAVEPDQKRTAKLRPAEYAPEEEIECQFCGDWHMEWEECS